MHLLLVGSAIFNLMEAAGEASMRDRQAALRVATSIDCGVPLLPVVLQRLEHHDAIVKVDAFPHVNLYRHLQADVHAALGRELRT